MDLGSTFIWGYKMVVFAAVGSIEYTAGSPSAWLRRDLASCHVLCYTKPLILLSF